MPSPTYQAIDPAVLLQLAGDRSTFRLLSQTFMEHAPDLFRQLVTALGKADYPAIGRQSHALKGMTTLVGAERLTRMLQQVESAARTGSPADAGELGQLFVQVMAEVQASVDDDDLVA